METLNDNSEFDERKRTDLKDEYTILQSRIDSYGTLIIQVRGIVLALVAPTIFICYQVDFLNFYVVKLALFAAIANWLYFEMMSAHSKDVLVKRIFDIEKALKDDSFIPNINVYELGAISRQLHFGFLLYGWKYYLDDKKNKKRKLRIKPFYKEKKIQKLFFYLLIAVFVLYFWNLPQSTTKQPPSNNFYIDKLLLDSKCSESKQKVINESNYTLGVKPNINFGVKPSLKLEDKGNLNMKSNIKIENNITSVTQLDQNISVSLGIINKNLFEQNILHNCCDCNSLKSEKNQ